ncbi:MAG: histidine triad nucleotide-binding protein [Gammaproteobacteria bacterium]|nr:histidine triad nucleotide-binding protein [Gammaproteobacteria bacterium]MDH5799854.1 histidine triad nucleotide-binding protein [Gammaproteobacteria bacterium]
MSDCLFCNIVAGTIPSDIVFEDEQLIVFKDIYPKADVHLLVIPRIHIGSLNDLEQEHDPLVAHMLRVLPRVAREQGLESGFRTVINTGPAGGQEVYHLHFHLLGGQAMSFG